jgi:hypothetical protein
MRLSRIGSRSRAVRPAALVTGIGLLFVLASAGHAGQETPTADPASHENSSAEAQPTAPESPSNETPGVASNETPGAGEPAEPTGPSRDFDPRDDVRRSSGLYGEITNVGLRRFLVLITAFLIGTFGAAAFHLGVYTGFIARESRPGLLQFLHVEFATRTRVTELERRLVWFLRISFWCFGGIVAVVFQMADADSLVPIQAFVLGASWPTVVTQLMSGRSTSPPPQPSAIIPGTPGAGGGQGAGGGAAGQTPPAGGEPPAGTAGEVLA